MSGWSAADWAEELEDTVTNTEWIYSGPYRDAVVLVIDLVDLGQHTPALGARRLLRTLAAAAEEARANLGRPRARIPQAAVRMAAASMAAEILERLEELRPWAFQGWPGSRPSEGVTA